LKQQNQILWHNQIIASVKSSVIDLKNVESARIGFGEIIEEALIALGIDMGELQKEGFSCCRFNCTIEPEGFE
jgi:hypothetical protein